MVCVLFFFFSSRRRHTRYWRDWSSDVCSSDLSQGGNILSFEFKRDLNAYLARLPEDAPMKSLADVIAFNRANPQEAIRLGDREERRVGKECRSRWSPYH